MSRRAGGGARFSVIAFAKTRPAAVRYRSPAPGGDWTKRAAGERPPARSSQPAVPNAINMSFQIAEVLLFTLIVVGGPWLAATVNDRPGEGAEAG